MTAVLEGPRTVVIDYTPTPRQAEAHTTYVDELLYGGAAGGGKSRWTRAEVLAFALEVPGSASIIFRRSYPDLSRAGGVIPMLLQEVPTALGTYNATEHRWSLHNGSTIELAHIGRDGDVTKYQGAEYQLVAWEELTQFTAFQYDYMRSRLRASGTVRDRMAALGYRPRMVATANPGGVGHGWVKSRFIDAAPAGVRWRPTATLEEPRPGTRCFIPAKVTDNPFIDEGYVDKLKSLAEDQRRALLEGDWDVYTGQRFREWRVGTHVIDPEQLPLSLGGLVRAVGVDYGLDAPFCALWGAKLADGLIVVYRELYAAGLTATEQAEAILAAEAPGERTPGRPVPVALDPSTWTRSPHVKAPKSGGTTIGGPNPDAPPEGSIAAAYLEAGVPVNKAHNDRLGGVSLVADKLRVRADGLPRILVYSTCRNLIRTLPALPRDVRRPEDVDTKAEDHAYDALRYLVVELERAANPAGGRAEAPTGPARRGRADSVPAVTAGIASATF